MFPIVEQQLPLVKKFLLNWQNEICESILLHESSGATFIEDCWNYPQGGGGISRVWADGIIFEKVGANFSHVMGEKLPPAATKRRTDLEGCRFQALGVSTVIHPLNPFLPTVHANLRFFIAEKLDAPPVWWFGGGFDLTPYYPFEEDCKVWHQHAREACEILGEGYHERFKKWADDYFFLPHRGEARGIGGLFFDDLCEPSFEACFSFVQHVSKHFIAAYQAIVHLRKNHAFTEQQKEFQLIRRGRYVEFNLLYDRGTLFGIQSGGRTESILVSLPPQVLWRYGYVPLENSPEEKLIHYFLKPRDWHKE